MTKINEFEQIDKVLVDWLPKYGLTVYREYKDEPVRTISVVDNSGDSYSLWLMTCEDGKIQVACLDKSQGKKGERFIIATDLQNLAQTLNGAYQKIENWISIKKHKRTWY